jgi:DNA-directed RNA polymerase specialized sigma24 family protein
MSVDGAAGGGGDRFPTTRGSAVEAARSGDASLRRRAFETLVAAYWKPVYKHLRVRWGRAPEDAQDLTQGFFLRAMEKEFFAAYDPARARFRTFLRTCLDGYVANEEKAARRLKRGGGAPLLSLDFQDADGELAASRLPAPDDLDRYFDAEWTRSLFELGVAALREECARRGKEVCFALFERYDLDPGGGERPTYAALAAEFGLPATQVTNHLAFARREFRRLLLEKLREITATDEEYRREARLLLGSDPPPRGREG